MYKLREMVEFIELFMIKVIIKWRVSLILSLVLLIFMAAQMQPGLHMIVWIPVMFVLTFLVRWFAILEGRHT